MKFAHISQVINADGFSLGNVIASPRALKLRQALPRNLDGNRCELSLHLVLPFVAFVRPV